MTEVAIVGAPTTRETYMASHLAGLADQISRLNVLDGDLHGIADRLLGAVPVDGEANKVQASPEGAIGECKDKIDQLAAVTDSLSHAVDRLQKVV